MPPIAPPTERTIYKGDDADDKAIAANVRRLRNRKDVKARIGELSDFAGKLAGIDLSRDARATERMSAAHNDTVTASSVTAGSVTASGAA